MGRILFGGMAALLICIFLSPKFIEFLRQREFGQQIREDGPEGHHVKAGTPTMGGLILFLAVSVSFLILTNFEWRSIGVFGAALACALLGFADDYTKLVKRRSLGLRARTKLAITIAISLGSVVRRAARGGPRADADAALRRLPHRRRAAVPAADLLRGGGHHQRREPHRRARRAGRRVCGDRAAGLHRDHVSGRRLRHGDARGVPGRAGASAFCGSTRSRPRSSWATRARWASAGRSRAWR